ncbi:hypothetical protein A4G99_07085 [Haladaptatus sp. R4]|uniref:toxin-antitoxin system TumE family protein n=1 Tax=Haladaptatus sp. R4 TaxID=1679489 RepID=UPI0007B499E1|nr:DUF6516 family protein [Haladaptatus sp. R4]KZN24199.1 hypothetical protein A4G99_07085 [Haladaptatus sp. R4]
MGDYVTVREETSREGPFITHIRVRKTNDSKYPCGWDYALHFGTVEGTTLVRYDNAHERTKGHERHSCDGITRIEFPGMYALVERFERDVARIQTEDER